MAINMQPSNREILKYLSAQKDVEGKYKVSENDKSKGVFMDPKAMSDNLLYLFDSVFAESTLHRGNGRSKSRLNKATAPTCQGDLCRGSGRGRYVNEGVASISAGNCFRN